MSMNLSPLVVLNELQGAVKCKKRTLSGSKSAKEWMKHESKPLEVLKELQGSKSERMNKVQGPTSWAIK